MTHAIPYKGRLGSKLLSDNAEFVWFLCLGRVKTTDQEPQEPQEPQESPSVKLLPALNSWF
jgi:hypothetical protein